MKADTCTAYWKLLRFSVSYFNFLSILSIVGRGAASPRSSAAHGGSKRLRPRTRASCGCFSPAPHVASRAKAALEESRLKNSQRTIPTLSIPLEISTLTCSSTFQFKISNRCKNIYKAGFVFNVRTYLISLWHPRHKVFSTTIRRLLPLGNSSSLSSSIPSVSQIWSCQPKKLFSRVIFLHRYMMDSAVCLANILIYYDWRVLFLIVVGSYSAPTLVEMLAVTILHFVLL